MQKQKKAENTEFRKLHWNNSVELDKFMQNELVVAKFRFDIAESELSLDIFDNFGEFDELVMNEVTKVVIHLGSSA